MEVFTFWNNKGGTGKTSLAFQVVADYAHCHSDKRILVIDLCPQANLTELLLGGLIGSGSANLATISNLSPRQTIGGYFEQKIMSTMSQVSVFPSKYICQPNKFNANVPANIDLVAGDRLVEIQSTALSALSNTQLPGVNPRLTVLRWIKDFLANVEPDYDIVFIDTNPSFAIYTQMGILATDKLLVPVMADDSSKRAIQNLFALVYGLNIPSAIYAQYQFNNVVTSAGLSLPKVHLIIRNRITQYMGEASAFGTVLNEINKEITPVLNLDPTMFSFPNIANGVVSVKDFGTTGVVSFAEGKPFYALAPNVHNIGGKPIQVNRGMLDDCKMAIRSIVNRL